MTICDGCPLCQVSDNPTYGYTCCLNGVSLRMDYYNQKTTTYKIPCPLKHIELKNGTVFVPEEINE
jgi:hypothetical protein